MYFIRSDLQHLLLNKINKDNGYLNLTLRLEKKNPLISINVLYQIKYIIFTIITKINENNDVF